MLAANDFRKKVFIEEQKAQNENRLLQGRQIAYLIHGESIWDFYLMGVTLWGDYVPGFGTKWDEVLLSGKKIPEDGILDNFSQDETRILRTVEVYLGIVYAGHSARVLSHVLCAPIKQSLM